MKSRARLAPWAKGTDSIGGPLGWRRNLKGVLQVACLCCQGTQAVHVDSAGQAKSLGGACRGWASPAAGTEACRLVKRKLQAGDGPKA